MITLFTPTLSAADTSAPVSISGALAIARACPPIASIPSRATGRLADHFLAGAPALVQRQRGNGRHLLERLQLPADGHATCSRLKAIIAVDATAELFHDDVHYIDGMEHVDEFELDIDSGLGMTGAPGLHARRESSGTTFQRAALVAALPQRQRDGSFWRSPVRPYGADTLLSNRRPARRLSRQHPGHAGTDQGSAESNHRPSESHLPARCRPRSTNPMARPGSVGGTTG